MLTSTWQAERSVAETAVFEAARLTKGVLNSVSALTKADASPVTVADFAAQALLICLIRNAFPNDDDFFGEEDAGALRADASLAARVYELFSRAYSESPCFADKQTPSPEEMMALIDRGGRGEGGCRERVWVMDPVDGTAAFLRGEQYAVALALLHRGQEVLGVVACPNLRLDDSGRVKEVTVDGQGLGIMFSAVRGHGASLTSLDSSPPPAAPKASFQWKPLTPLEAPANLADIHIVDCALNSASSRGTMQRLAAELGAAFPGTDVWSSHVRYAALVLGGGDLLIRIPTKSRSKSCIWDHAGAQLIFTELGGVVTDLDGKPMDFSAGRCLSRNRGLLAARKGLHDRILTAVQKLIPPT